jgi:nucleoside-diphosphate-sugar epimerase
LTEAVIIVGASGFVGRNLVNRLAGRVGRLIAVTGSPAEIPGADQTVRLADIEEIAPLPRVSVLVQLAAQRYDAKRFDLAQSDLLTGNVDIGNRVLRFCLARGISEVRLTSSVAVYPSSLDVLDDSIPVDLNAAPNRNEAFYAWSKRYSEIAAVLYQERYGINTLSFRLSNPYGPYDSIDPDKAHVLPAFVIRALTAASAFEIKGNPLVERDFIYVQDVVDVLEQSLVFRGVNDQLNLCRGETTTLLDLARIILSVAGVDRPIHAADTVTYGVLARRSTNARLREIFGKQSFATLEQGLRPTIDWYRHAIG